MNRREAEAYIYKSYLKAEKYQDYDALDSDKRHPELTRDMIRARAGTPCVIITGSKGKGSIANMISQILQTQVDVGLMTSPHIQDFCERFKVNGENISDEDFSKYMDIIRPEIDSIEASIPDNICISPMGIQTVLGLEYFNARGTDFNILECGKGVRYDDVNNATHEYAVIGSIFLEHTRELGSTLEEIAEDKSHILNGEQRFVYVADQSPEVLRIIRDRAAMYDTEVKLYGADFRAENIRYTYRGMQFDIITSRRRYENMAIPLLGTHQAMNCALAMALCEDVLGEMDTDMVRQRLSDLYWPGRLEVLGAEPLIILDACISSVSCRNILDILEQMNIRRASVIIGIPDDKDYLGVAREMSSVASRIILTKSDNSHYIFTAKQVGCLSDIGINALRTESVEEALDIARSGKDPIIILGTTSVVAEVKNII